MATDLTYPHIEKLDGEPARLTRLPRVRVAQLVMDHLAHGWSAEKICEEYPHLRPAEVHSAMAYYYDHRQEIEGEIEAEIKAIDAARAAAAPSAVVLRLRAKGLLR